MKIKGILFDAEDVIYSRDEETLKPIISFFKENGLNITTAGFRGAYEEYKLDVYNGKISKDDHLRKVLEYLKIKHDNIFFEKFANVFRQTYSNIKIKEGVKVVFEELKQKGIKIGILTDTFANEKKKWEWFREIGLDKFIDSIICSSETGFTKDKKEAYMIGIKRLGLEPNEVFFVGHQKYEMDGARKAGVKSVSIVWGIGEDMYIDNLNKIIDLI